MSGIAFLCRCVEDASWSSCTSQLRLTQKHSVRNAARSRFNEVHMPVEIILSLLTVDIFRQSG